MDGLTLTKIINILKRNIINLKLKNVLLENNLIQLHFHGFDKKLNFSLGYSEIAIYYDYNLISSPNKLNYLETSVVKDVFNLSYERVLFIELLKYRGSGKKIVYTCVFELFTKYPNFFVLDDTNKIIFKLKEHFLDTSRENIIGNKYKMVKRNKHINIDTAETANFNEMQGFYSVTIGYANLLANEMGFEKVKKLFLESMLDDKFYIDNKDRVIPFPIKDYKKILNFEELSQYKKATIAEKTINEKKKKILAYLIKLKTENEKALKKVNDELNEAKNYKNYLDMAELLKNNLHTIHSNSGLIYLDKYTEKGIEKVAFELKNGNVKSDIEKLFSRGKKLRRALHYLEDRIKKIERKIDEINREIQEIEKIEQTDEIHMYESYYLEHKKNKERDVSSPFFKVRKGNVLYIIGKNKKSNNILITKVSHKDDLWFHVKDAPSAHVIAKKNSPLTDDELIFGAKLAATFSKLKNEQKVAVDYTHRKYITKPKKAPEGYVHYNNFKTLYVEPLSNLTEFLKY